MKTHEQKLAEVREAVVKATANGVCMAHDYSVPDCFACSMSRRSLGLEDVLRTMQQAPKRTKIVIDDYGVFWDMNTLKSSSVQTMPFHWELGKSLDQQSPKTIAFLHSIIV